jgi:mannose-6-phosphate isomerase-like protein (cupin superfamily)
VKIKHRRASEIAFVPAPNRLIGEVYSGQTLGALGVTFRIVELAPAPEQGPRRPHRHLDFEEVMHFLSGQGRIWAEGEWQEVGEGDSVLVPPGVLHATFNTGAEPLRMLCFFPVPDGVDDRQRADFTVTLAGE